MDTVYSHPGKQLKDHLQRVLNTGIKVFNDKKGLHLPYPLTDTRDLLTYILLFHDTGKMTPFFQTYLHRQGEYKLHKHQGLTNHGLISALIAAYQVSQFFKTNPHRWFYTIIAFAAVRRHHGNLEDLQDLLKVNREDRKIVEKQIQSCEPTFFKNHFAGTVDIYDYDLAALKTCCDQMDDEKWAVIDAAQVENYFYLNFLYSILLFSDKHEAIFSTESDILCRQIKPDIVDRFKKISFKAGDSGLNRAREGIYREAAEAIQRWDGENRIFSINVPTGSGKTLCSLNAALRLRERSEGLKRIIYCLPFTSVIDQNAAVFENILSLDFTPVSSDVLLTHHHLVESEWQGEQQEYTGDKAEFLIETWSSELVVTTFWQFFHTLFSHKNALLKKFHSMANSIIILDEIQAIPVRYWTLLNKALVMFAHLFNCHVILVTATMPMIFSEARKEIVELVPQKESYFKGFNRVTLSVDTEKKEIHDFTETFIKTIERDKRYLIILNTIQSSLEVYHGLRLQGFKPLYLSTNIVPKHRLERIHYIKQGNKGDILVSTQLVEAGVDIDFDVVYRDNAPLDSINQGAGRCNRESRSNQPGQVFLVYLVNQKGTLFAHYIYDQLLLNTTDDVLKDRGVLFENAFFHISQDYFDRVSTIVSRHKSVQLLENIGQLKYQEAFTGKNAFKLIESSFERENVFVEVDEEAQRLRERYQKILLLNDRRERKNEFSKIKNRFYHYVISISKESLKKNLPPEENGFYFIPFDQLEAYYHLETGFKTQGTAAIW